jgi:hypothetical protein
VEVVFGKEEREGFGLEVKENYTGVKDQDSL